MRVSLILLIFFASLFSSLAQDFNHYLAKGDSCLEKRELSQAITFYNHALKTKPERLLTRESELVIFYQLSHAYTELSDYQKALEYLFKYVELDIIKQNDSLLCDAYNSIGSNYDYLLETKQALKFYKKSLDHARNHPVLLGRAYNNMADSFQELKRYKEAKDYYLKGLEYFIEGEVEDGKLVAYINLGTIEVIDNRMETAQQYFENAHAIAIEMQDTFYMVIAKAYLAEFYTKVTDYEKAEALLNWTLKHAKSNNMPIYINEAYKRFVDLFEKKKDYQKAFEYMKHYKKTSDSISKSHTNREYAQLEAQYSIREKEKENDLLKKKNDLIESQVKSKEKYIWMISGMFFISLIFMGLFYYQRVKRSKARKQLEIQNKEISKSKKQLEDLNFQYEKLISKYEGKNNE